MSSEKRSTEYASSGVADVDVEQKRDIEEVEATEEVEITPEEKRLVRKLDRRILPIVCLMYLFACKLYTAAFIIDAR